jgi:group I intron endonuclease
VSKISGIYAITHYDSGRLYIGSAINISERWYRHLSSLRRGRHENSYLQRAWNKYGEEAFILSIFDIVEKKEDLIPAEQAWIDKTPRTMLFNRRMDAASGLGVRHSPETCRKISENNRKRGGFSPKAKEARLRAITGVKQTPERIAHRIKFLSKRWVVTDPTGQNYQVVNLHGFCREQNLDPRTMVAVARGYSYRSHHKGWKCRYADSVQGPGG